ncbi:MAG: hypothetical protein ACI4J5_08825 [Oscillospiraceae bacterium]
MVKTIEEVFCDLCDKYGKELNWTMIPFTQARGYFVDELKKELGCDDPMFQKEVYAVAKCDSNDDVLYLIGEGSDEGLWRIYHLTYSHSDPKDRPRYEEFTSRQDVGSYIEKVFVKEYL